MKFTDTVQKLNPQRVKTDFIAYSETAIGMLRLPDVTQAAVDAERKSALKLVALVMGSDDYVANIGTFFYPDMKIFFIF